MKPYVRKFKEAKYKMRNAWHVLPIGVVNLKTGDNKFFNVFEDDNVLVLVSRREYNFDTGKQEPKSFKGIIGYAGENQPLGWYINNHNEKYVTLQHDQSFADMGNWELIEEFPCTQEGFADLMKVVNKKSLICAVMK